MRLPTRHQLATLKTFLPTGQSTYRRMKAAREELKGKISTYGRSHIDGMDMMSHIERMLTRDSVSNHHKYFSYRGWIRRGKKRYDPKSKRDCYVYHLTDKGRAVLLVAKAKLITDLRRLQQEKREIDAMTSMDSPDMMHKGGPNPDFAQPK